MTHFKELIRTLLEGEETKEWIFFQNKRMKFSKLGKMVCALANTAALSGYSRGIILWGISQEERRVTGTDMDFFGGKKEKSLQEVLYKKATPALEYSIREERFDRKRVCLLEVMAARELPAAFEGRVYIMQGDHCERVRDYPDEEKILYHLLLQPEQKQSPLQERAYFYENFLTIHIPEDKIKNLQIDIREIHRESENKERVSPANGGAYSGEKKGNNRSNIISEKPGIKMGDKEGEKAEEFLEESFAEEQASEDSQEFSGPIAVSPLEGLNKTQKRIYARIQKNPHITKAQLSGVLGLGKTTIDKGIATLRQNGAIERIGSNKTGHWKTMDAQEE